MRENNGCALAEGLNTPNIKVRCQTKNGSRRVTWKKKNLPGERMVAGLAKKPGQAQLEEAT